jgi:hypothetical protein
MSLLHNDRTSTPITVAPRTIKNVGCALTTLDMALQYAGASFGSGVEGDANGPIELNSFLSGSYLLSLFLGPSTTLTGRSHSTPTHCYRLHLAWMDQVHC